MNDSPHVVLIDEDAANLKELAGCLRAAQFSVTEFSRSADAFDFLSKNSCDAILARWNLSDISGGGLCRQVRRIDGVNHTNLIFLTDGSAEARSDALETGADDVVDMLVGQDELIGRVRLGVRITERTRQLNELANRDPLTGLFSRNAFRSLLKEQWRQSTSYARDIACIMVDIDYFKRVNDTMGHAVGDEVIRQVADTLVANCREHDVVGRYGGEEFCIMLPSTDEDTALQWANKARQQINQIAFSHGGRPFNVTASFGVAQRMVDTVSTGHLIDMADQVLLVAKQAGRDRVVGHTETNHSGQFLALAESGSLFADCTAKQAMTRIVACLRENDTVGVASDFFLRFRLYSSPIVNDDGHLVGVISEKDLLSVILRPQWWSTPLSSVMKTNTICYEEDTPIPPIYDFLTRATIRRVIVTKDQRPTGIISRASLMRWAANSLATHSARPLAAIDCQSPKSRIAETARLLAEEAEGLEFSANNDDGDLAPGLIGGVSRMQELVNDLLSVSSHLPSDNANSWQQESH